VVIEAVMYANIAGAGLAKSVEVHLYMSLKHPKLSTNQRAACSEQYD